MNLQITERDDFLFYFNILNQNKTFLKKKFKKKLISNEIKKIVFEKL